MFVSWNFVIGINFAVQSFVLLCWPGLSSTKHPKLLIDSNVANLYRFYKKYIVISMILLVMSMNYHLMKTTLSILYSLLIVLWYDTVLFFVNVFRHNTPFDKNFRLNNTRVLAAFSSGIYSLLPLMFWQLKKMHHLFCN